MIVFMRQTASQETWPEAEPWGRRLPLVRAVVGRRQTSCPAGQRRARWCGGYYQRLSASCFLLFIWFGIGETGSASRETEAPPLDFLFPPDLRASRDGIGIARA